GTLVTVKNDPRMDQSRLLCTELFGIEAVALQVTRTLVRKEDVGVLQQAIECRAIVLGVVQDRRTHANLDVPDKRLDFGVVWPPDVENIRPVTGEISAHGSSGDHVPHSERTNAVERTLSFFFEGDRLAVADLLH